MGRDKLPTAVSNTSMRRTIGVVLGGQGSSWGRPGTPAPSNKLVVKHNFWGRVDPTEVRVHSLPARTPWGGAA